jgi:ubiquinone/menaquinone biosynthesis C-methylase UbiE
MANEHAGHAYVHGTSEREQARLVRQADILRPVLLAGLDLAAGERVLEVGCGVGAVLGELAAAEPTLQLTGLDQSAEQLAGARRHLDARSVRAALIQGDALALPFAAASFDRVVMVWVLEHLADEPMRLAALREALRVLRPGGRIDLTDTDYGLFRATPRDAAIDAFLAAFVQHFDAHGDSGVGPRLGPLLETAGFAAVDSRMHGLHFWCPSRATALETFAAYILDFVRPELAAMTAGRSAEDAARIRAGAERFGSLARTPDGSFSATIWRATGRKTALHDGGNRESR